MRNEYDFSKSIKNPYTKKLKQQITIRIDPFTINYFKELAKKTGLTYQQLINLYLMNCAHQQKKPSVKWL